MGILRVIYGAFLFLCCFGSLNGFPARFTHVELSQQPKAGLRQDLFQGHQLQKHTNNNLFSEIENGDYVSKTDLPLVRKNNDVWVDEKVLSYVRPEEFQESGKSSPTATSHAHVSPQREASDTQRKLYHTLRTHPTVKRVDTSHHNTSSSPGNKPLLPRPPLYTKFKSSRLQARTYHSSLTEAVKTIQDQSAGDHVKLAPDPDQGTVEQSALQADTSSQGIAEDQGSTSGSIDSMPGLFLPIVGSLAALGGLTVMVAIFKCCCKKKGQEGDDKSQGSEGQPEEAEVTLRVKKTEGQGHDDSKALLDEPSPQPTRSEGELPCSRESSEEPQEVSFRTKIKRFEEKKILPQVPGKSPDLRYVRKRPESEAFRKFEEKGILIGIGKSPSALGEASDDDAREDTSPSKSPNSPKKKPVVGGFKLFPDNPDVVIASDDEDDDVLPVIKRDTEILRSFTKAPPPKNRNRSSMGLGLHRKRPQTTANIEGEKEPEDEKKRKDESAGDDTLTVPGNHAGASRPVTMAVLPGLHAQPEEKKDNRKTFSPVLDIPKDSVEGANRRHSSYGEDKSENSLPHQVETERLRSRTPVKEPTLAVNTNTSVPTTLSVNTNASVPNSTGDDNVNNCDNIFVHIDPTVQNKSRSTTPKPPLENTSRKSSPESTNVPLEITQAPRSPQMKRGDNLMKDLAEKLKSQGQGSSKGEG